MQSNVVLMEKGPHDYDLCKRFQCKSLVRVIKAEDFPIYEEDTNRYGQTFKRLSGRTYKGWKCPTCGNINDMWEHHGQYTSEDLKNKIN